MLFGTELLLRAYDRHGHILYGPILELPMVVTFTTLEIVNCLKYDCVGTCLDILYRSIIYLMSKIRLGGRFHYLIIKFSVIV